MKAKENEKMFQRLNEILTGSDGVVYLMFMGRDTYATKIKRFLVGTIFRHDSNVDQVLKRLLKHGSEFLVFKQRYREERTPGREAKIYTARFDPMFLTLRAFDINFDEKQLQHVLECLSTANDSFPQYLLKMFETPFIHKLRWKAILANYFTYLSQLLLASSLSISDKKEKTTLGYSLLLTNIAIPKKNIDLLLSEQPDLTRKVASIATRLSFLRTDGLNKAFRRALIESLPTIDAKFFKIISNLKEMENFLRQMKRAGFEDIQSIEKRIQANMEATERIRETEEFLEWKRKKEKTKA